MGEMVNNETWNKITDDIDSVFCYSTESRPQDRAHTYLEEYGVQRVASDTAMQAAVLDMCERAYELGRSERIPALNGMAGQFRDLSAKCMELSVELERAQR